ncbi:MAG TPA: hypothetical protein ENH62_13050 [Marinobacter sp.]|uniref:Uncharacterized protein n=1 Tax=marine sediment metagenome TaxID=412755 RepID=A0A0F9QA76_9ZZZZ|nr:hypothetical protein [Marinobacter sp.]
MKRWMTVLIVSLLVAAAGCNENQHFTAWGMAASNLDNPQNDYTTRFGLCNGEKAGDVEGGIEVNYSGVRNRPESYAMYGIYHLDGDPSSWVGQPYVGYRVGTDGGEGGLYGPIVGTIYWDIFVIEGRLAQEYTGKLSDIHNDENDENMVAAGLRFDF